MLHTLRTNLFCFLLIVLITACTTVAPPSPPIEQPWKERERLLSHIQSWKLNGKIAVRTPQDSLSATLDWTQNQSQYSIALLGPLGSGSLTLSGHPGSVTLEMSDGKRFTANNPEELLAKRWGYQLPVSNLRYWVRGLPAPGSDFSTDLDALHRISVLKQQGFNIQFLSYTRTNGVDLPSRIMIASPTVTTKIVVHQWKIK